MLRQRDKGTGGRARIWLGAAALLTAVQGCAAVKGFPDRANDPAADVLSLKDYLAASVIDTYHNKPNMAAKRAWRDQVIDSRLHAIDLNFVAFEQALYTQGIGTGVGTDWLVLALTGAGSVAGSAANALSAAAAGVTGARASFDKNALYEKTLPALLAQMVAKRKTVLVRIRQGQSQDVDAYTLGDGLSDLEDYYFSGTIPGAIGEVAANASEQGRKADLELKRGPIRIAVVDTALNDRQAAASDFIKTLKPEQQDRLARALKLMRSGNAEDDIVDAITAAQTPADLDVIARQLKILFQKGV